MRGNETIKSIQYLNKSGPTLSTYESSHRISPIIDYYQRNLCSVLKCLGVISVDLNLLRRGIMSGPNRFNE